MQEQPRNLKGSTQYYTVWVKDERRDIRPVASVSELGFGVIQYVLAAPLRRLVPAQDRLYLARTEQEQLLEREHAVKPGCRGRNMC